MNVGDSVWLPLRLRTGPIAGLVADVNTRPGVLASIRGDWAMVRYPKWGEFGCRVDELEPHKATARR